MSRGIAALAALMMSAMPIVAQRAMGVPPERLAARVDSLAAAWREASAPADLADSLANTERPPVLDTVTAGALTILVNPTSVPVAAAAVDAWRHLDSLYGDAAARIADGVPARLIVVPADARERTIGTYTGQEIPDDMSREALTLLLRGSFPVPQAGQPFDAWLGGSLHPPLPDDREAAAAYLQLVTLPYAVNSRCLQGEIASCRAALDLLADQDPIASRYQSPEDRRYAISQLSAVLASDPATTPTYEECIAGRDDACRSLLDIASRASMPRPLGVEARGLLAWVAVRLGGRAGYLRLVDGADRPPISRLEAAAGVPVDSIIMRWRAEVLAARPQPVAVPVSGVVAGLGWMMVLAACALGSSRWRVT